MKVNNTECGEIIGQEEGEEVFNLVSSLDRLSINHSNTGLLDVEHSLAQVSLHDQDEEESHRENQSEEEYEEKDTKDSLPVKYVAALHGEEDGKVNVEEVCSDSWNQEKSNISVEKEEGQKTAIAPVKDTVHDKKSDASSESEDEGKEEDEEEEKEEKDEKNEEKEEKDEKNEEKEEKDEKDEETKEEDDKQEEREKVKVEPKEMEEEQSDDENLPDRPVKPEKKPSKLRTRGWNTHPSVHHPGVYRQNVPAYQQIVYEHQPSAPIQYPCNNEFYHVPTGLQSPQYAQTPGSPVMSPIFGGVTDSDLRSREDKEIEQITHARDTHQSPNERDTVSPELQQILEVIHVVESKPNSFRVPSEKLQKIVANLMDSIGGPCESEGAGTPNGEQWDYNGQPSPSTPNTWQEDCYMNTGSNGLSSGAGTPNGEQWDYNGQPSPSTPNTWQEDCYMNTGSNGLSSAAGITNVEQWDYSGQPSPGILSIWQEDCLGNGVSNPTSCQRMGATNDEQWKWNQQNSPISQNTYQHYYSNEGETCYYPKIIQKTPDTEWKMEIKRDRLHQARRMVAKVTNEEIAKKDEDGDTPSMIVACKDTNEEGYAETLMAVIERQEGFLLCCDKVVSRATNRCGECGNTDKDSFYSTLAIKNNEGDSILSAVIKMRQPVSVINYIFTQIHKHQSDIVRIFDSFSLEFYHAYKEMYPILKSVIE